MSSILRHAFSKPTLGEHKQQSASGHDREIAEHLREAGCAPLKVEHAKNSAFIIFETPFLFIDIQKTPHPVKTPIYPHKIFPSREKIESPFVA
ncbi:hypothetical protein [Pseudomonas sp. WPR_5_2]|uniref:hypothetical protein n=1 Tax=Pseudomonas sp. WPR_5_2 TaxID=1907371 RepID=UPI0011C3D259|nr:hypothetical protein [Pseudomonas sp. WPR_5_2]